jgi:GTPase SAR1 family protein
MTAPGLGLSGALTALRDVLAGARYPLRVPQAAEAGRLAQATLAQLDDYLIPRLARLDAPLLVVVGGSTGAGKSTLVNSLVRDQVSPAGARRPTTRSPVLVCHPGDADWFTQAHLLPRLGRTHDVGSDGLRIVPTPSLAPGLALLDAPDIDSVVESNRALAEKLLAAADLWLFVTTATRYADAVPWELLHDARRRGTAIALVLDRVPPHADEEVVSHLTEMLSEQSLDRVPLFVVPETSLTGGLLPEEVLTRLRDWLTALAHDAQARALVVRQTVDGAVAALAPTVAKLADAADAQDAAAIALKAAVDTAYADAESHVDSGVRDGSLFRGEVLARWQELVGTGEFMRGLQARVSRWRDRVVDAVTGRPRPTDQLAVALESHLVTFIHGGAADAAEQASSAWKAHPAGAALDIPSGPGPDVDTRLDRLVRDWQRGVLELVRKESSDKLYVAKAGAYAINALGLAVMITVFAATAFIPTGAEIAVAGGTTLAAQKVLEAIFGDQAVRKLADSARQDLRQRVHAFMADEAGRYLAVLASSGIDPSLSASLRAAAAMVSSARSADPVGGTP